MIGECMRRFLDEMLALSERTGEFKVHFATAREAFNIAMAAVDGQTGEPGLYRDYRLRSIMPVKPVSLLQKRQEASEQAGLFKTGVIQVRGRSEPKTGRSQGRFI
jgi:hypothetical protein